MMELENGNVNFQSAFGPSYYQQLYESKDDPRFIRIFDDLRDIYGDDYSGPELMIVAFIRLCRLRDEFAATDDAAKDRYKAIMRKKKDDDDDDHQNDDEARPPALSV